VSRAESPGSANWAKRFESERRPGKSIDFSAERLETYDEHGSPVALAPRGWVHAQGLWHKSAHVFLFTPEEELYVQRRTTHKDIHANRWDYSVGGHLQPGESYLSGALRVLEEELGVPAIPLVPLGGERRCTTSIPGRQVCVLQHLRMGCFRTDRSAGHRL